MRSCFAVTAQAVLERIAAYSAKRDAVSATLALSLRQQNGFTAGSQLSKEQDTYCQLVTLAAF